MTAGSYLARATYWQQARSGSPAPLDGALTYAESSSAPSLVPPSWPINEVDGTRDALPRVEAACETASTPPR